MIGKTYCGVSPFEKYLKTVSTLLGCLGHKNSSERGENKKDNFRHKWSLNDLSMNVILKYTKNNEFIP